MKNLLNQRLLANLAIISLLGFFTGACTNSSHSSRTQMASNEAIVEKKLTASVHPTERYYLNQVMVQVDSSKNLAALLDDMAVKEKVPMHVMDKIVGEPIYLLEIENGISVPQAVAVLKTDSRVIAAQKNSEIRSDALGGATTQASVQKFSTNDVLFDTQWSLNNHGQEAPAGLAGRANADMGMNAALDTTGSAEVVVGVIDTGIDYTHEDLAITENRNGTLVPVAGSNIWINPGEVAGDGIDNDNNGDADEGLSYVDDVYGYNFAGRNSDPRDDQGHGTHVSGTIGALRNNFKGVSGVAEKVSLMALKFLAEDGSGSTMDAVQAINYAIAMKKRFPQKKFILSNSWGGGRQTQDGDNDDILLMTFQRAENADILSVVAAGNAGTSNRFTGSFPANYSTKTKKRSILAVAATNNMDQLASFSSFGSDNVQVAAPGVNIMSTVPAYLPAYGGAYAAFSGTSMATPHVTGLAVLVWSQNPQMTAAEVKDRIVSTVDVLPQLKGYVSSGGRINVKRALANDINVAVPAVAMEVPYVISPPRLTPKKASASGIGGLIGSDGTIDLSNLDFPAELDLMTKVTHPGAKEIAVCFSRIDMDEDTLQVLGGNFRMYDELTGSYRDQNFKEEKHELCTASMPGDTAYLRLIRLEGGAAQSTYKTSYLKVIQ